MACGSRRLCSREAVASMGGVARTRALRCTVTPVGKPPAALDAVGALLKVAEGPGKLRDPGSLPVAGGYFWTGVFFFLRPLSFVVDTNVCVFADHLLCTLRAQLLKLSSHITRFSRREASSNTWHVCGDLLSH